MSKNELTKTEPTQVIPTLENNVQLANAKMIAEELSKSDLIPKEFQKKPANCLIAVELANRLNASPFQVMQNMDVIYGRPSLRSSFIIACINNSGKIQGSLKFAGDGTSCQAWAIEKETGEKLIGPKVTMDMAQAEGWLTKSGSKWKTMPGLMMRYRAAAFFGRLYCPEILTGMISDDEARDIKEEKPEPPEVIDVFTEPEQTKAEIVTALIEEKEVDPKLEELANQFYEEHKDDL